MGFAPKAECPNCGKKTKVWSNPTECECGTKFNLVNRTAKVKLNPDEDLIEKVIDRYSQLGEFYLDQLRKRFYPWTIVKKSKGECFSCGEEKNLTMKKDGDLYCSLCGKKILYGDDAEAELRSKAEEKFEGQIPRKSYFRFGLRRAITLFDKWLSDNWGAFVSRSIFEKTMQECKKRATGVEIKEEAEEITKIREKWVEDPRPSTPFRVFDRYVRGSDINQTNRSKRRQRLHELSSEDEFVEDERNFNDLALQMATPACEGCEHLHKYSWGYECELYIRRAKITNYPSFPTNLVDVARESYEVTGEKLGVYLWELRKEYSLPIIATKRACKKLKEKYDFPDWPDRPKVTIRRDKETGEYFLDYPLRSVAQVEPGDWKHFIGFGPKKACVLSAKDGNQNVKFFNYAQVQKIKEHYDDIRRKVDRPEVEHYWDNRPRHKERDKIDEFSHRLTHEISEYLSQYPGKAFVLNFQKEAYGRKESYKHELNQRLRKWTPYLFKEKLDYKLELAGLIVEEIKFELTKESSCPYCDLGWDKSWQQLVIEKQVQSQKCPCGADTNVLLGMNKQALSQYLS